MENVDVSARLHGPRCRFCDARLSTVFVDLGMSPLSNDYLTEDALNGAESFFPLRAYVCDSCFLAQLEAFAPPERIFGDYAYFSSYSESWLEHARVFAGRACDRLKLGPRSLVIEAASNDGYLLQYFQRAGVPVLGVEPARNVAEVARQKNIPTLNRFMGTALATELAAEGKQADLLIGINVFAHVPDLHDFTAGLARLLKPEGTLCLEFPHLLRLIEGRQFDTIYHEHFSYFSLATASRVLAKHGLAVFDVEEEPTHGGSLRLYACHAAVAPARSTGAAQRLLDDEARHGLGRLETYREFGEGVRATKRHLLRFLIEARERGEQVVGYGAPAKGNTLLNYCGVRDDLLAYTVDLNPRKQGRYLPGTHIPIYAPGRIAETRPAWVLILPWNLRNEIVRQMAHIRDWGGKFVVPIPRVEIVA
ncbi:MAG: class I SAM-dependent methyltransferase [Alphaproteobacteria bacterium]|nr:class I SAM-dependent methyltransferase [Alphaproteobacteria bacterium]